MDFKNKLEKYAELVIKKGINLQNNQLLVIRADIESKDLVNQCAKVAYSMGASDVEVIWGDDNLTKMRFENASKETLSDIRPWFVDRYNDYQKRGAAFLSIVSEDPELLKFIDPDKVNAAIVARGTALKDYQVAIMNNLNSWCVIGAASKLWAEKVFPEETSEKALEKLWDLIFFTCRINDGCPIEQWDKHIDTLQEKSDILNNYQFKYLYYKSSNGTDLKVELPKDHIWAAAGERNVKGMTFVANMPTEEIFTMPKKDGVNGIVYSTKPLNYGGNLIEDFYAEFKDGKVVNFGAEKGYEVLKNLLETDENAKYLGEVALVPYDSPISNTNTLFLNTLYDENASCHLAFGKAYPTNLKGGEKMTKEELEERGVNDSITHEDFMIGTKDLSITGEQENGEIVQIFENGNWAF